MEALRKTLEWIFLRETPDAILKAGCLPKQYCGKNRVFNLREVFPSLTLDQIETVLRQLDDVWMHVGDSSQLRYVEKYPSVFNTLLHFSSKTISESEYLPCIKYDSLLRWQEVTSVLTEDLFTTPFLASKDLALGRTRDDFSWNVCIGHDNVALNCIFERPMIELHSHLKGASLNFELNWLCLMNKPWNRKAEFDEIIASQNPSIETLLGGYKRESLYYLIIKAAAIRMYLVMKQLGMEINSGNGILSLIHAQSESEQKLYLENLKSEMGAVKQLKSKRFQNFIPDYAITGRCCKENHLAVSTVLTGERAMMYHAFREIYQNETEKADDTLLYVYLLIKNRFRQELIQTNLYKGFSNFGIYERRKEGFVPEKSQYAKLLPAEALATFFSGKTKESYIELRITPKPYSFLLDESIKKLKKDVLTIEGLAEFDKNYRLILHFIKKKDNYKAGPRHKALREEVRSCAIALVRWRNAEFNDNAGRIVGIDAANSELFCRPEVFSQAYRFCRLYSRNYLNKFPNSLHFTYHVGEDFYDVVDGLRAVWESIHFLGLGRGDRIGHGLVLGTDVEHYYAKRKGLVYMPKQILLDNIVWLLHEADFDGSGNGVYRDLNDVYHSLVVEIFGHKPFLDDYFQSICLRGDNPELYHSSFEKVSRWNQLDRCEDSIAISARRNDAAIELYRQYHYYPEVVSKGARVMEFQMTHDLALVVDKVRLKMLRQIEELGIAIETNPTSNLKIGQFSSYEAHPLMEFNNVGLYSNGQYRGISVSINTDDRGVFGTSLEREFSLVAAALEKQYQKGESDVPPRIIYDWLDRIRAMAFEQKFV